MLQDCQILSPTGVTDAELKTHLDVLLKTMDVCINQTDIQLGSFEFLAMVAGRRSVVERCGSLGQGDEGQGQVQHVRAYTVHRYVTCITIKDTIIDAIMDTIILNIHTNEAYTTYTHATYLGDG
jgi:hypothetical protein